MAINQRKVTAAAMASLRQPHNNAVPAATAAAPAQRRQRAPAHTNDYVYEYKRHNPAVLLSLFVVSAAVCLYCLFTFLSLRRESLAAQALQAQVEQVQNLHARQQQLNRNTQDKWDLYAEHRANVTSTLMHMLQIARAHTPLAEPSLIILGAGNLNDLNLSTLLRPSAAEQAELLASLGSSGDAAAASSPRLRGYASLSLVDLDARAMENGWRRQVEQRRLDERRLERVRMYAADVTGSFDRLSDWKRERVRHTAQIAAGALPSDAVFPTEAMFDAWLASMPNGPRSRDGKAFVRPDGMPPAVNDRPSRQNDSGATKDDAVTSAAVTASSAPTHFDVSASVCLLSQLLDMYMSVVPDSHPRFLAGVLALRDAHVWLMLELLRSGGWAVLVTDIVASTTVAELRTTPHAQLSTLLPKLLSTSNFFTGCNPRAIEGRLRSATFKGAIRPDSITPLEPWSWRIGGDEDKRFLVYALAFQKV